MKYFIRIRFNFITLFFMFFPLDDWLFVTFVRFQYFDLFILNNRHFLCHYLNQFTIFIVHHFLFSLVDFLILKLFFVIVNLGLHFVSFYLNLSIVAAIFK